MRLSWVHFCQRQHGGAAMAAHEDARALLQQRLRVLATSPGHASDLCVLSKGRTASSEHFHGKQAWINAKVTAANLEQLRALVEIVGQLSKSAGFQWRECYNSFWKRALMVPLACSSCRVSIGMNPEVTEFDSFEQLMSSDGPRFILDFSKVKRDGNPIELLRGFFLQDPRQALGANDEKLLTKLAANRPSPEIQPN